MAPRKGDEVAEEEIVDQCWRHLTGPTHLFHNPPEPGADRLLPPPITTHVLSVICFECGGIGFRPESHVKQCYRGQVEEEHPRPPSPCSDQMPQSHQTQTCSVKDPAYFYVKCQLYPTPQQSHTLTTIRNMEDRKTELDVMAVKSFLHTSMQALFGICNAAHHIDVLRFDSTPGKAIVLLRIASEGYKLLLQTLPTISLYQEKRCTFHLLDSSPLLSQIQ